MKKTTKTTDGTYVENGITYNKYGVCLDCNGGNPECTHNNLVEEGGKTICAMCGLVLS